jgi:SNF2 family DNA or RNA helicase
VPYAHQLRALELAKDRVAFCFAMEQGTGKTKVIIDEAAQLWADNVIDALLVTAPNGVHIKWVTLEIPTHMPDWCEHRAAFFAADMTQDRKNAYNRLYLRADSRPLRIMTINSESLATAKGIKEIERFLRTFRCMWALDESQRFKNPGAKRTKELLKLGQMAVVRRCLSGTPQPKSPFDWWAQMAFLDEGILDQPSYTAFKAEHAVMAGAKSGTMYGIRAKMRASMMAKTGRVPSDEAIEKRMPQIIERDVNGDPIYRNLDKLQAKLKPYVYRVLKTDCLDLPPKVYDRMPFEMTKAQAFAYKTLQKKLRVELEGKEIIVSNVLAAITKLQQLTSGYIVDEDKIVTKLFKTPLDNPRIQALQTIIEGCDEDASIIIWARFHQEMDDIMLALREMKQSFVEISGRIDMKVRMDYVTKFQARKARFIVGHPAAGGTGFTMNAASETIYYSNTFDLEKRLQSEDRAHRIGTKDMVRYTDLEALDSIDSRIISSLRAKKSVSDAVLGDGVRAWI